MAKKQQVHRKKNYRGIPIVPDYVEAGDPKAVCPSCHASFPLSAIGSFDPCGEPFARCPVCGAPCTPEAYDREARRMIGLQREVQELHVERSRKLNEFDHHWIWRLPLVGRLLSRVRERRRNRLKAETLEPIEAIASGMVSLDYLAVSRYLTSEYHLMTRTPLKVYKERGGYCMRCYYDEEGAFAFDYLHGYSICRGFAGEIKAFECLADALRSDAGLSGARLIPNIFVRKNEGSNPFERGSYFAQIDMVLLTRRAAYVFEA